MDKGLTIFVFSCLGLLIITSIVATQIGISYQQDNIAYTTILKSDIKILEVSSIAQKGSDYYSEASFFYEQQNYNAVESNCRLARGYFSDASQGYKDIQSSIKPSRSDMVKLYGESLGFLSETQLNLFEACEHFESASRYYDDDNYEQGDAEIEMMNEKITLHDDNIRKYNSKLADFHAELEDMLE